ncbi:hypothetical protein ABW20_dc0102583 [Dactylellina cionopaga]|nr:hypothetical protein ABW20_dc0102583 [Dactylellina cionopaga]
MAAQGPLTKLYSQFLVDPKKDVLHAQAGLHYISSTANSIQSNSAIISHFTKESFLYNKKEQKVLSAVESGNAVVLEVSVVIEFTNGAGIWLPGLDDNFITDQTVILPVVHIVQFEDNLIKQIRVYWDQGSLLKNLAVIGKTGKNWPIRFGEDQVKLIKSSISDVGVSVGNASVSAASTRPSSKSSNQSNRESFQLFGPREDIPDDLSKPAVIPPRAGMRPPSRPLHELVGETDELPPVAETPKAGGGKGPRRTFFVGQDIDESFSTPDRKVQVHSGKFKHFDFNDEPPKDSETQKPIAPKRTSTYSKQGASWDFADFTTPEKRPAKLSTHNARTYTWSDDDNTSPVKPEQRKLHPRKDTESHFDIVDETPKKDKAPVGKSYVRPSSETHFDLTDDSPAHGTEKPEVNTSRNSVLKGMEANWSNSSPLGEEKPVNDFAGIAVGGDGMGGKKGSSRLWGFEDETPKKANGNGIGIKTAGNGMGGRKGTESNWAFDSEGTPTQNVGIKTAGNGMGGKGETQLHWGFEDNTPPAHSQNVGIKTAGNGMGGKGETQRHWGFEDNTPPAHSQNIGIKPAGNGMGGKGETQLHWGFEDNTPPAHSQNVGIKPAGNGMGGKGETQLHWGFEDNTPPGHSQNIGIKSTGNGMGGRKGSELHWGFEDNTPPAHHHEAGIKTAGNGMGGKKGAQSNWTFGDDEEDEDKKAGVKQENAPITQKFRKQSKPTSDFWEF